MPSAKSGSLPSREDLSEFSSGGEELAPDEAFRACFPLGLHTVPATAGPRGFEGLP
jgi:hypothetical protein